MKIAANYSDNYAVRWLRQKISLIYFDRLYKRDV